MHWLPLTLICAFALASSDAATKRWLSDLGLRELTLVRLGLSGALLAPWVATFELPPLPTPFWIWLAVLIPLEIVAMLLYMRAIRDYPLALTVPYLAFTPVFVILTGWLVLDEHVSGAGAAGIGLVVAGSWLLNLESVPRLTAASLLAPLRAIAGNPGARLMLVTAVIYALTSVGGKAAMHWLPAEQFGALYFTVLGSVTILLVALSKPQAFVIVARHPSASLLIAGLMAVMVVTHFMALDLVETAYMITVKRTSLLFGILYGALLFGEQHLGRHLLAGCLMLAGVALIV